MHIVQEQLTLQPECFTLIALWALFSATLSLFLDFCFSDGNIFEVWLDFWADWWLDKNKPEVMLQAAQDGEWYKDLGYESAREYKHDNVDWFWFKPLGGCVVCMNVWISFLMISLTGFNLITCLFFICVANALTRYGKNVL